jgi:hypothetical protein
LFIPPQAGTTTALKELYWTSCKLEKTLDHCYSNFRYAYKTIPALLSVNMTTTPFYSSLPIGRNSNRKYPC